MKDFKKMPKMACGGGVKKYSEGGNITMDDIMAARKSKQLKATPMPIVERDQGSNVPGIGRVKTIPAHIIGTIEEGSNVPGIGRIKPVLPPATREGSLQPLKKGGRIAKKKGTVKKNK